MIRKIEEKLNVNSDDFIENWLQSEEFRNRLAIAVTHFAFRNGPIEEIHENPDKNITDADMKRLNKYMVNAMASILKLFSTQDFPKILSLALTSEVFGYNWDKPDTIESEENLIRFINTGASFGASSFVNKHNLE